MRCFICKRSGEEVDLYEGILEDEMVMVCSLCAENERIPIIKKPSQEQLKKADVRYNVRERMERLSGMREATEISPDQINTQKNLARLKIPKKKQLNKDIFDDYDWKVKIGRRRRKMTISQLARAIGIDYKIIQSIEYGKLPENFREVLLKLESFLNVNLLKHHEDKTIIKTDEDEQKIINNVKRKMGIEIEDKSKEKEIEKEKKEKLDRIYKGEADFSKREDLANVTLSDLVEMKRVREKREKKIKEKEIESELIGDEIDIELEEE